MALVHLFISNFEKGVTDMAKRYIAGLCAFLLAIIIPVIFFLTLSIPIKDTYSETFVAALGDKYERLCSINEPKLIIVGGSSTAFGLNSALIEENIEMPTVNFGLYATLGTKMMMDLSKANIGKGDIIVLSPEMNPQTLSLYFNAESAWQAIESDLSMLRYISTDNYGDMVGEFYNYGVTKFAYKRDGVKPSSAGIYRRDSFNEYGDIVYKRKYNTLYESSGIAYDTANKISLSTDIISEEFIDYVNAYTKWCKKRGATVYFSFCPMNRSALVDGTDSDDMLLLFDYLSRKLDCAVINAPSDTVYDAKYFYDTNFHLNDAGVTVHTDSFVTALLRAMGRYDISTVEVMKAPSLPSYAGNFSRKGNEYDEYFVFEKYGSGYCVIGTTEKASGMEYLEVPSSHLARSVIAIGPNAFKGCEKLTEIKIYDSVNIFSDRIFAGLDGDLTVYMAIDDATYMTDATFPLPQVSVELMADTLANVRFMFSQACFERYLGDYNWQQYSNLFDIGIK